jgi:hypothetical protein
MATVHSADEPSKKTVITDPAKGGDEFAVQGEYTAEFTDGNGMKQKIGVQVIALGAGKFRAVGYTGGLPGDGWTGNKDELKDHRAEGSLEAGVATFKGTEGTFVIKDGKGTIYDSGGSLVAEASRIERQSPTLGDRPPAGVVVLFDGSDADEFPGAKMTEEGLLVAGADSAKKFKNYTLHLEFRTPFMPDSFGQDRGNSGVYVQDIYEIQVLDSFGLEGLDNECGGIYSIKAPDVNMCYPPLSWQTYDIEFKACEYGEKDGKRQKIKNAVITVKHNGVAIHDKLELPNGTPGRQPETDQAGVLHLQDHGNPVVYRNIWVIER